MVSEVELLSRGRRSLRFWRPSESTMPFAHPELIDRPYELGGGRLAVLGFGRDDNPIYSHKLVAYNLDADLDEPAWAKRIESGEPVPQPSIGINRQNQPGEFIVCSGAVCDIFKEPPGDEIVAVHVAYGFTQCIIRIYDLAGNILFEVWHDGTIRPYHIPNSSLLVFSGVNGEKTWGQIGYRADQLLFTSREQHPPVVFAIRPTKGQILHEYIEDEPGGGELSPAWYQSVRPPVREIELNSPWRADRDSGVGVLVTVEKETGVTFSFDLNQDGIEIPQPRQRHNWYLTEQASLPNVETFEVVPFEALLPLSESP